MKTYNCKVGKYTGIEVSTKYMSFGTFNKFHTRASAASNRDKLVGS